MNHSFFSLAMYLGLPAWKRNLAFRFSWLDGTNSYSGLFCCLSQGRDFHLHPYPVAYALSKVQLSESPDSIVAFVSPSWKCLPCVSPKHTTRLCNLPSSIQGLAACVQGSSVPWVHRWERAVRFLHGWIYIGFRLTSQSTILQLFLSRSPIFWHISASHKTVASSLHFVCSCVVTHSLHLAQWNSSRLLAGFVSTAHSLYCISYNL